MEIKAEDILDLRSRMYHDMDTIDKKLDLMMRNVLRYIIINVKKERYNVTEAELYYHDPINHPDPFVHCDDDQAVPHRWYFHKINNKGYKGGSFKGVDITFKGLCDGCHCGILVRSIRRRRRHSDMIEGPCKVVDKILEVADEECIKDLVDEYGVDLFDNNMLKLTTSDKDINILASPRVGLTLKKDPNEAKHRYLMRDYRYTVGMSFKKCKNTILYRYYLNGKTDMTKRYLDAFNERDDTDKEFYDYHGKDLKADDLLVLMDIHEKYYRN